MHHTNPVYHVGDASVTRIDELAFRVATPETLYPDAEPATWSPYRDRLGPGSFDPESGVLAMSIHSWLLRTPDHVILIDAGAGNDKERPHQTPLQHLSTPFLTRLAAAGVTPDQVDLVLMTHIHSDHVGWNTVKRGDAWIPTFPNARHVASRIESAYGAALDRGEEPDPEALRPGLGAMHHRPQPGVYADSVAPVAQAGLVDLVAVDGHEIAPGLSFLPSPGHSIDHASIRLVSRGEEALFTGDVMHHPLQVYAPAMNSVYCEFPEAARRSRLWALGHAADRGIPLFTSHFAESSVGRVARQSGDFAWSFL